MTVLTKLSALSADAILILPEFKKSDKKPATLFIITKVSFALLNPSLNEEMVCNKIKLTASVTFDVKESEEFAYVIKKN
jgi:hypothetical protein